jgi:hypothetical protein
VSINSWMLVASSMVSVEKASRSCHHRTTALICACKVGEMCPK